MHCGKPRIIFWELPHNEFLVVIAVLAVVLAAVARFLV